MNFEHLKEKNKHLSFYHISGVEFRKYGKMVNDLYIDELKEFMKKTSVPTEGNEYIASISEIESYKVKEIIQANFYGEMPIQIGYCNGRNSNLNGLEYHKGNEINIAITDFVLLLGSVLDIEDNRYDVDKVEAFYIPEGTVLELYATTLHFAPCKVRNDGFKAIVILPVGTNRELKDNYTKQSLEDELLFMINKWLIVHPDRKVLVDRGAYPGIVGENLQVNF